MECKKIALFASGSGSNVQNIIEYFFDNEQVIVDSVWSNNPSAYVLERASKFQVKTFVFGRDEFNNSNLVVEKLKERGVDFIVLAGFLWLIPSNLIQNFKIVNIHPALLPNYGGKGMYGMNVHKAVVENKETESGISIHFVNEKYDEGELIFQAKCPVLATDSPDDVANKIHELEHKHFPEVIEKVLKDRN
ncbi:MAG: phosphoribosylglycinamide formyltransferase [Bacteroidetes bacterium]|nr:phosphoribosylglycinamide formyltransferase [Bacteroidota bacterium]